MLVVDSTVWVDFFNGIDNPQTGYLNEILDKRPILVGDLILAEVLQGFREDADFEKARKSLGKFTQVEMVSVSLAVRAARNFRFLRGKGVTVRKTIDSLIATFCIENNHDLLHIDSDFDGYEEHLGLKVIHS